MYIIAGPMFIHCGADWGVLDIVQHCQDSTCLPYAFFYPSTLGLFLPRNDGHFPLTPRYVYSGAQITQVPAIATDESFDHIKAGAGACISLLICPWKTNGNPGQYLSVPRLLSAEMQVQQLVSWWRINFVVMRGLLILMNLAHRARRLHKYCNEKRTVLASLAFSSNS